MWDVYPTAGEVLCQLKGTFLGSMFTKIVRHRSDVEVCTVMLLVCVTVNSLGAEVDFCNLF